MPLLSADNEHVWSIVIKLSPEQAASLNETLNENNTNVQIRFVKDDITTWATGRIFGSGDSMYAELEMTRYMIRYISDRYIDIELTTNEAEGLKIPSSSVVEKISTKFLSAILSLKRIPMSRDFTEPLQTVRQRSS